MSNYLKTHISGMAVANYLAFWYSLPWYAGIFTANLVLLEQEITELQMDVKLYFALCDNMFKLYVQAPFCWAARHTTMHLNKD